MTDTPPSGAARAALASLVALLARAVAPEPVVVADDPDAGDPPADDPPAEGGTTVRPLALERVGRFRRDAVVLDLRLVAEVAVRGPRALDLLERHLVALERSPTAQLDLDPTRYDAPRPGAPPYGGLRVLVAVPVAVVLDEPSPPLVTRPPVVRIGVARPLIGRVVTPEGRGIRDALVHSSLTGATSVTDAAGRFRSLTTGDATRLVVTAHGRTHVLDVAAPPGDEPVEVAVPDPAVDGPPTTVS